MIEEYTRLNTDGTVPVGEPLPMGLGWDYVLVQIQESGH